MEAEIRAGAAWRAAYGITSFSVSQPSLPTTRSTIPNAGPLAFREIDSFTMADSVDSALASTPATASTKAQPTSSIAKPSSQQPQSLPIRESKSAKPAEASDKKLGKSKDAPKPSATESDAAGTAGADKPLTPAELKKKAKAEKAARRAREKLAKEGGAGAAGSSAPGASQGRPPATPKKDAPAGGASQRGQKAAQPRRGSAPSGTGADEPTKKEDKSVAVFGHLYGQPRRATIAGAGKEVHPAVLALGLQLRDYVVCGSSARCVATLLAFKRVSRMATEVQSGPVKY